MKETDYSILIVDDEPANARLLERVLGDSYPLRVAQGGTEALEIASGEHPPALILLDVMMPDIDGFEVCRRLKADERTKDIMVIFVTAMGDSAAEEVGLNLGAVDYITKPISVPIVRARVRNHMNVRRKADMLEAMSYIDSLTHTHNRRRLDKVLESEWQRAQRSGRPLALVMIDFDHFKALNDHYGHGTGDICLQQGANALATVLKRPGDLLARYGGEEFVALLPETDRQGARLIAEQMREAVKALALRHDYSSAAPHVTVSLGVAAMVPEPGTQASELLERADRALNQAKSEGRDRVVIDAGHMLAGPMALQAKEAPRASAPTRVLPHPQVSAALPSEPEEHTAPESAAPDEEWRAPLALIINTLERLLDSELSDAQRVHVQALKAAANRLRALHGDLELDPLPPTDAGSAHKATNSAAARRLLLVEDDRANQMVIQAMLRKLGYYQVDTAASGREALAQLAQQPYDLILMDCHMPDLDGLEATRRLREGECEAPDARIPVIGMGAFDSGAERDDCLIAGMNDYLVKPLDLKQLAETLEQALAPLPATRPAGSDPD